MRKKLALFLVLSASFNLSLTAWAADSAYDRWSSARRQAASNPDFAFMDYLAILRDYPKSAEASEAAFAVGEYYFDQRDYSGAADTFKHFLSRSEDRLEGLVGLAYLAKSAELGGDAPLRELAENTLKQRLASGHFFMLFEDKHEQPWRSPFGRRIVMREYVDRLEITLNGSSFYTVQLP